MQPAAKEAPDDGKEDSPKTWKGVLNPKAVVYTAIALL